MKNKNTVIKCNRKNCRFNTPMCKNHCSALSTVYANSKDCAFYKRIVKGEDNYEG